MDSEQLKLNARYQAMQRANTVLEDVIEENKEAEYSKHMGDGGLNFHVESKNPQML